MTEITITTASEEPGARNLKVEVPVERVEAAETKAARYYAKRVKLPGFRKGKVPLGVIRKKFRDAIRETVLRELVDESWKAAVAKDDFHPIAEPRVTGLQFDDGNPLTFEFAVAVKPQIRLDRIGGFELTRKVPRVTDAMIDAQLEELRKQRAPWAPVESGNPKEGELTSVTITQLDDEAREGQRYQFVLGQGQALADIEEQVKQLEPGQSAEATVTFPDDFSDESKRGQTRKVRIELHEIKRQDLPALDDSFAGEVGDFDSLDALRAAIRSDLEAEAGREGDASLRNQLLEQIMAANSIEAPRPMVQRVLSAFAKAYEVPDEHVEKFTAEFTPVAERQVKRDLIIDHVAQASDLKATEDEVDDRVAEIAKKRGVEPGQVYASLQKANRLNEIERGITEEKIFAYLLEQSTVNEETD
ncbi:MAG: trigger factor [Gemmatimonadales bacterium]